MKIKLTRYLLRYYPPGIIIEYEDENASIYHKSIDLLNLNRETDLDFLASEIILEEPLLDRGPSKLRRPQLKYLLSTLQKKVRAAMKPQNFSLYSTIEAHLLPITSGEIDKYGTRIITSSYDRTAKMFDLNTGKELMCFEGHSNVVYGVTFNKPYSHLIGTFSFDKTARIWDANTGTVLQKLIGHEMEVVRMEFNVNGSDLATASIDHTARLWDVETGECLQKFSEHALDVVDLNYDHDGKKLITASWDKTAKVWDIRSGKCIHTLKKHKREVSCAQIDFIGEFYLTGSVDKSAILWDAKTGKILDHIKGHSGEVITAEFSPSGDRFVTASADGTAKVVSVRSGAILGLLGGHSSEVIAAGWNAAGTKIYTLSETKIRLWDAENYREMATLSEHASELIMARFNYEGDILVSFAKDNTCRVWKDIDAKTKSVKDNDLISEDASILDRAE